MQRVSLLDLHLQRNHSVLLERKWFSNLHKIHSFLRSREFFIIVNNELKEVYGKNDEIIGKKAAIN